MKTIVPAATDAPSATVARHGKTMATDGRTSLITEPLWYVIQPAQ